jgi:hypothetical protein
VFGLGRQGSAGCIVLMSGSLICLVLSCGDLSAVGLVLFLALWDMLYQDHGIIKTVAIPLGLSENGGKKLSGQTVSVHVRRVTSPQRSKLKNKQRHNYCVAHLILCRNDS